MSESRPVVHLLLLLDEEVELAGAALGEVGEQPVGVVRRADVGVAPLAQLDAALLAALLPVRPARVDRLVALLAEHRRL